MDPTDVGVIGDVGRSLVRGFASGGHDVMIGSRSPDKRDLRERLGGDREGARAGTFDSPSGWG